MLLSRMIRLTATIGQINDGDQGVITVVDVAAADGTGDDSDTRETARGNMAHRRRMTVMQPSCATWARGDIGSSRVPSMAQARSKRFELISRTAPRTIVGTRLTSLRT